MPKRKDWPSDFSDCTPITSPSKHAKRNAVPEQISSSDEDEDSLVTDILSGDIFARYYLELQVGENSVIILNKNGTEFFIRDFNSKRKILWETRYASLQRKGCSFISDEDDNSDEFQGMEWVYMCSCDKQRSDMVAALGPFVNMKHEEWLQLFPECIHVRVLKIAIRNFDATYSLTPGHSEHSEEAESSDELLPFLDVSQNVICAKPPSSSWGIVTKGSLGMKCITCSNANNNCVHIKFVLDSLESDSCPDFVSEFCEKCQDVSDHHRTERQSKCLSYKDIPFDGPHTLSIFHSGGFDQTEFFARDEIDNCPFCDAEFMLHSQTPKEVPIYTQYQRASVHVYSAFNSACPHQIPFDGSGHGILNMKDFLIGYDVLRDYFFNFLNGRMPLFTFYTCWKQRQLDAGHEENNMLSYFNFRIAWYSFLSLSAEDLDTAYICPVCKDTPSVVIFDATCLAFRRSYVPRKLLEKSTATNQSLRQTGSTRFSERVMINHKKTRELVQCYCNPKRPLESVTALLSALSTHSPSLKKVVQWCLSQNNDSNVAPKEVRSLLISLAKVSPVCALVPATEDMRRVLLQMMTSDVKQHPQLLQSLQALCPVLFDLVKALQWKDGSLPAEFCDLLSELWRKASAPFENTDESVAAEPTAATSSSEEADPFLESVSVWPRLPRVRERGTYPMDVKSDKQSCRKLGKSHKSLLPGTVTLHCQHDICYGFEVLLQVESPNTIFSILRTRFRIAPKVVIYDFACGLHNYCLNRDAKFFQQTKFLIDRYHQPNHKGCSLGYKMALYPQFKNLNSQIAEQKNSKLSRIRAQLSYMNPTNFICHSKFFLWYNNKKRIGMLTS